MQEIQKKFKKKSDTTTLATSQILIYISMYIRTYTYADYCHKRYAKRDPFKNTYQTRCVPVFVWCG